MIMHGKKDTVIPVEHGYELSKKIPKEYHVLSWFPNNADHNDLVELNSDEYIKKVSSFINYMDNEYQNNNEKKTI